jgi:hypothetical protein
LTSFHSRNVLIHQVNQQQSNWLIPDTRWAWGGGADSTLNMHVIAAQRIGTPLVQRSVSWWNRYNNKLSAFDLSSPTDLFLSLPFLARAYTFVAHKE